MKLLILLFCLGFAAVANANLIALYELEGNFSDTTGTQPDGVPNGSPEFFVDPERGNVLSVSPGNNVDCGVVTDSSVLNMTVGFWVVPGEISSSEGPITSCSADYSTLPGWKVYLRNDDPEWLGPNDVWFRVMGEDPQGSSWEGGDLWIYGDDPIYTPGEWIHLTFTFDDTSRMIKGYVDGLFAAERLVTEPTRAVGSDVERLILGGQTEPFTGLLDEVALWNRVLTDDEVHDLYNYGPLGIEVPGKASNPNPADGATKVWIGADLSWNAGFDADSYDVYFGTDETAVTNAGDPDTLPGRGRQTETTYDPGTMDAQTTYYWRIDSVNAEDTTTGQVWSFTTDEAPSLDRNTFLVPVPSSGSGWEELAYLAAVPASAACNTGPPSVIALDESGTIPDEVLNYLTRYNPANTYTIDTDSSLDEVACYLAQTFWTTTATVVLCDESNYAGALAASALAGRMEVPLLYFDSSTGLSTSVLDVIDNDLQCSTALTVGGNTTVTSQLSGISVSQILLADSKEIITWMRNNGYPVDYLAATNVKDRTTGNAPKSSLAAALLAAGRNGAVAPLSYDADFNHPFMHSSETTSQPAGAATSADGNYLLGTMTLNGGTYNYVITLSNTYRDFADQVNIDFNHNGNYGDPGELIQRADIVDINGKRYSVGISPYNRFWYGDLRFTYPSYEQINEDLAQFYDRIGHHPKYMAIVGFTDVFPFGITCNMMYNDVDYHITDQVFANVDSDPFYEIATGRMVGENVTFITLFAARCLTYSDLVDLSWAQNMSHVCPVGAEFRSRFYTAPNQFENCGFNVENWYVVSPQDRTKYGVFVQDEHGWPFGIEPPTFGPIAPCVVETGGCNIGAVDENYYDGIWRDWKTFNAVVLARQGAVCLNASVRGTPATKDFARDNFYKAILYDGATLGEARLHELHSMIINQNHYYHINGNVFYGDPAVKIYTPPVEPTYDPAHVTANGNTLTVHAPEIYWVDFAEIWFDEDGRYIYAAPGLGGSIYDYSSEDPAQTFIAAYTTDLQITDMTQEADVPTPLGWKNDLYMIDEHYDNTRTVYWQVRFDDFDYETGLFNQTVNQINYTLTGITCGDFNQNGGVDLVDFSHLAARWSDTDCQTPDWCSGADLNTSGTVDLADYVRFISHWLDDTQVD
jgi:hypothetical protein